MIANKLKMNPDKMEALWVSGNQVQKAAQLPILGWTAFFLNNQVCSLGVLLTPILSL